jgi:hypothetical protein
MFAPTLTSSGDVGVSAAARVRRARAKLRWLQQRQQELQGQLSLQRDELRHAETLEVESYKALIEVRRASNQQLLDFAQICQTQAGFQAARQLLSVRNGEDALTLANLQQATAELRSQVLGTVNRLQAARDQARRELGLRGRDAAQDEQQAFAQRAETLRLQQEWVELGLRSEAAALKHAQELFGAAQ